LTQPLTEMSTRNISLGVKATGVYSWQPYHLHVPVVWKPGSLTLLEPSGPLQACVGLALFYIWWHLRNDVKNYVVEVNCEENGHVLNTNHGAETQRDKATNEMSEYFCVYPLLKILLVTVCKAPDGGLKAKNTK